MPLINGFSGGGGNGKIMQQFTLPQSAKYNGLTAAEWKMEETTVPAYTISDTGVFDGERLFYRAEYHTNGTITITKTDLQTWTQEAFEVRAPVRNNAYLSGAKLFYYKDNLYVIYSDVYNSVYYDYLARINQNTITTTSICRVDAVNSSPVYQISTIELSDNVLLFGFSHLSGMPSICIIDFTRGVEVSAVSINGQGAGPVFLQKDRVGKNVYIGVCANDALNYYVYRASIEQALSGTYTRTQTTLPLQGAHSYAVTLDDGVLYAIANPAVKQTGTIDLTTGMIDMTTVPDFPKGELYFTGGEAFFQMGDEVVMFATAKSGDAMLKRVSLSLLKTPPEENPVVLQLFKGDVVNTLRRDVEIDALTNPPQEAFSLTRQQQEIPENRTVHLGQYDLSREEVITVIKP